MAQQSELQIGVAGQTVILNCRGIPHKTEVTWKYNNLLIRQYGDNYLKGKASKSSPLLPGTSLRNLFPSNQAYFLKRQSYHDQSIRN